SGNVARKIAAGIVIGADGADSTVAKRVAADCCRVGRHASAVIYTRASGLRLTGYHWHYAPEASVGVIPTNGGETLLFAAASQQRFMRALRHDLAGGFHEILRKAAPSVAGAMHGAPLSAFRAFAGRAGFFRSAWGPGWALVGDAGYFKDPI